MVAKTEEELENEKTKLAEEEKAKAEQKAKDEAEAKETEAMRTAGANVAQIELAKIEKAKAEYQKVADAADKKIEMIKEFNKAAISRGSGQAVPQDEKTETADQKWAREAKVRYAGTGMDPTPDPKE